MAGALFDLHGKVAIVTGSTRGIGRAIAGRLAEHGARVVVSSRTPDAVRETVDAIREAGGDAIGIPANAGRKDDVRALVDGTLQACGGLDVVVANAAANPYFGPLAGIGDEAYEKTLATNVQGALWLANAAFPAIAQRGGGAAILLSSVVANAGSATLGAYAISKAALLQLARNLAVEWGGRGIRVNTLLPGIVRTEFARALWDDPAIAEPVRRRTPLGRLGEADDVAGAAVFFASDAARYVTGASLVVDGGMTVGGAL